MRNKIFGVKQVSIRKFDESWWCPW